MSSLTSPIFSPYLSIFGAPWQKLETLYHCYKPLLLCSPKPPSPHSLTPSPLPFHTNSGDFLCGLFWQWLSEPSQPFNGWLLSSSPRFPWCQTNWTHNCTLYQPNWCTSSCNIFFIFFCDRNTTTVIILLCCWHMQKRRKYPRIWWMYIVINSIVIPLCDQIPFIWLTAIH